ncbi:MAG: NUDIX domain-containing protein [Patescibacteria group bacterium]
MTRFKLVIAVYLILIKDDKILLQRRYNTGYKDGNYSLPAGHLDDNESITQALLREVKEEIDLDLKPEDVELVHIMHRREDDIRIDLFFTAKKYQGIPRNAELDKCDDLSWFPLDSLPENTLLYIREAIKNYFSKTLYSEVGWK